MALRQWLHQNVDSVVSMYEDRFDLYIFQMQRIEVSDQNQKFGVHWWKKLALYKATSTFSPLQYIVISPLPMSVKRTKELRALNGWYESKLFCNTYSIKCTLWCPWNTYDWCRTADWAFKKSSPYIFSVVWILKNHRYIMFAPVVSNSFCNLYMLTRLDHILKIFKIFSEMHLISIPLCNLAPC